MDTDGQSSMGFPLLAFNLVVCLVTLVVLYVKRAFSQPQAAPSVLVEKGVRMKAKPLNVFQELKWWSGEAVEARSRSRCHTTLYGEYIRQCSTNHEDLPEDLIGDVRYPSLYGRRSSSGTYVVRSTDLLAGAILASDSPESVADTPGFLPVCYFGPPGARNRPFMRRGLGTLFQQFDATQYALP